jgi:hypothetical protein
MAAARRIAKKKVGKKSTEKVKVKATVTIETSFDPYINPRQNTKALDQIKVWIEEVLEESDSIPLFINSQAGEETGPKKIKVKVERVTSARRGTRKE